MSHDDQTHINRSAHQEHSPLSRNLPFFWPVAFSESADHLSCLAIVTRFYPSKAVLGGERGIDGPGVVVSERV
jgi:hypothetical protein